ncbi:MAG TPA: phosphatase PAP2 family protein [Vicinamibacterales bacterium]|nr:phosphatase PAP2 family protein [Vicinamibacterales bacterium]
MSSIRLIASLALACAVATPAFAQEPAPAENTGTVAANAPSTEQQAVGGSLTIPRMSTGTEIGGGNFFKLTAGDFKNFFNRDTGHTLTYAAIVAVAAAPWDREGVNNGFNIPTTVFQSGNVIGSFVFQMGAGFATYGIGKSFKNQKLAYAGRDLVRAQVVSQVMVQTLKYTVRRDRPDHSNTLSFPSGHSSSAFATATVLQRYYGWKVGGPAYAVGSYVALARMSWNKHHATDVVMGAGFGIASARTVTMSMAKSKFSVGVQPQTGGASINFTKIYK